MPETPPLATKSLPQVFISYSRKDDRWRTKLHTFLKPAIDSGLISLWDDRAIEGGDEWNQKIDEAINSAAVAVLLLSPDYLASTWIKDREAPHILERAQKGGLRILPILLKPCPWQQVDWLRSIQIFPPDAKALVGNRSQDKLFVEVAQRIVTLATAQTPSSSSVENILKPTPEPVRPPDGKTEVTVEALSSFVLSSEARDILRRAQVLGTFGDPEKPKVTSSCLLFGISEGGRDKTGTFRTPQFFWRELQQADSEAYDRIFYERFPRASYSSAGNREIAFDRFDKLAERISDNVLRVFERAQEISRATLREASSKSEKRPARKGLDDETQYPGHIGARHLLAALLVLEETNANERVTRILDVPQLRERFFGFIRGSFRDDDFEAWQEILGAQPLTATEEEPVIPTESDQDFRAPLAGFSADYWEGEDLLGITRDVNALASLVAARSIDPPLSIGLFGDWGSGKTHFMRQMRARVQKLSQKARDSSKPQSELGYHKKIVQIEFNAWHYIEGNLWASLVEHIFDNLRVTGQRDGQTEVEDAREKIMEQLGLKQELQKKVEQRQEELKTKAEAAKDRVEKAKNKRDDKSEDLSSLIGTPEPGAIDRLTTIEVSSEQIALLKQFGIEGTELLPSEIHKKYKEAQTAWGRIRAQWNVFRTDPRQMNKLIRVLVVVVITAAAGLIFRRALQSVWGYLASVVAFVATAWKAAKPYIDKFQKGMAALKEKYDQVEKERQKKIVALESEVNSLTREMAQAENEAKAINKEVSTLETQLRSTDAAKLLAGFIEARAACEDYRRHLGVLALIRRDFEKLSNLLSEQRRDEREHGDATENEKAFSRIILYIDDLDRCPPEQVVKVLQAIHLLLAFPLFVVIVGVDARWVTRSLQESYDWLGVNADEDKNKDKEREPNQEKREMVDDRVVTPHDYLEKIFQIPFWLKPMGERDCANLLDGLTKESRDESQTSQNADGKKAALQEPGMADEVKDESSAVGQTHEESVAAPTRATPAQPQIEAVSNQSVVNVTSREPVDAAVATGAGETISKQEEIKTPATIPVADEQIDLAPHSLTLTENEIGFMKSLSTLIGRSPRAVKRFLNCYRLIKVGLRPGELEVFMGRNGEQGRYAAVMLLLGIITGAPSVSLQIIEELEEYERSKKTLNLNTLLTRLEEKPEVTRQADWIQVREILEDKIGFDESGVTVATLMQETPRVSRYSFRVAKAAAGQKRVGAVKATTKDGTA